MTALFLAVALTASPVRLVSFDPNADFPASGETKTIEYGNVDPHIAFNEVVPSWNVDSPEGASVTVQIRSHGDGYVSKWFSFGDWSLGAARTSVKGQKDDDGNVDTDTFIARRQASTVDVRLTLRNTSSGHPRLKLFTLAFANTKDPAPSSNESSPAWGKTVEVPQRAQGNYPGGEVLCSPTSLSMVLAHYGQDHDVPEVEANVWDKAYDGAGNWAFNAAYAGSFPGMRAYVTRFRGIQDLQSWIAADRPVICSINLAAARGKPGDASGHLVVLVGFTKDGDPIFNDPAKRDQVRITYTRADFERAWLHSSRAVYLVYPENAPVPPDEDGVWMGNEK